MQLLCEAYWVAELKSEVRTAVRNHLAPPAGHPDLTKSTNDYTLLQ